MILPYAELLVRSSHLTDAQLGKLIKAICRRGIGLDLPPIHPTSQELGAWLMGLQDEGQKKYEEKCVKNQEAANARWNADAFSSECLIKQVKQSNTSKQSNDSAAAEIVSSPDDAVRLIQAFDAALVETYGQERCRPYPAANDRHIAAQMIAAGADPAWASRFFRERMAKLTQPPKGLSYFRDAVPEALQAKQKTPKKTSPYRENF
jgi:hypothetical protein